MIPRCTSHLIKISHLFWGKLNKYTVRGYRWFQGAFRIIILVLLVVTTAGVSITANYRRQHLQLLKLKSHILYISLITKIKNKHCWLFFPFTFRNHVSERFFFFMIKFYGYSDLFKTHLDDQSGYLCSLLLLHFSLILLMIYCPILWVVL